MRRQVAWWSQSPGAEPGSRRSATAAQRSVALMGPRKLRRVTPSASTITSVGTASISVALVEVALGRELDVRHGHLVTRQHLRFRRHLGALVAHVGREHGDEPGRLGSGEVVPIELFGHVVPTLRRGIGNSATLDDVGDGRGHDDDGQCDQEPGHGVRLTTPPAPSSGDGQQPGTGSSGQIVVARQRPFDEHPARRGDDQFTAEHVGIDEIDRDDRTTRERELR